MSVKPHHDYDFRGKCNLGTGKGSEVVATLSEEDKTEGPTTTGDRAITEFSRGSLRNETNQLGTQGRKFQLEPKLAAASSSFPYPETLKDARHPVQDFWVYDGAHPGLTDRGSIATDRLQILPNHRISEQEAIEWQRVGSKKGWMFNGKPQEAVGQQGENVPTHTDDGFYTETTKKNKWAPLGRSADKQGLATRMFPAIDIENNARGIGVTGEGSGNGGMAGGYHAIDKERLGMLPIPMAKYNWTGSRVHGTGREDVSLGHGAGGFRSGYASQYPVRPAFPVRRTTGLSRVTQSAA